MRFETRTLGFTYPAAPGPALADLDLTVPGGTLFAVIGPNGCGKTTLLRILLGVLPPSSGHALYAGRPVTAWPRRELARRIGVVAQEEEVVFPMTVRELVAMGRYPHLGPWRHEGPADRVAVADALRTCDIDTLADRPLSTLSGGERQRARLARALAQQPESLVLDEPTAALDVRHEMEIFELLRDLADSGVTVVIVTHQLNIAARFADRVLLLDRGRTAAQGEPGIVLEPSTLEAVYGWPVVRTPHPGPGPDAGAPQITPLRQRRRA
jgi:iron complex transport system ATP-binding protein